MDQLAKFLKIPVLMSAPAHHFPQWPISNTEQLHLASKAIYPQDTCRQRRGHGHGVCVKTRGWYCHETKNSSSTHPIFRGCLGNKGPMIRSDHSFFLTTMNGSSKVNVASENTNWGPIFLPFLLFSALMEQLVGVVEGSF